MAFTFIKTVSGRKYRYKRISTKRKDKKIVTTDRYLGPVDPVIRGKIEQAPQSAQRKLITAYQGTATLPDMIRWFKDDTGITVSGRTITNYMTRHKVKRGFTGFDGQSEHMKDVHAQRKRAKTTAEKRAVEHLKVLLEEGVLKPADVVRLSKGLNVAKIEAIWAKYMKKISRAKSKM